MNQSQGGNPFGRLVEFARPHKTSYIVSVVIILLGMVSDFRRLLCPKSNIDGNFHEGVP